MSLETKGLNGFMMEGLAWTLNTADLYSPVPIALFLKHLINKVSPLSYKDILR